MGERKRAGKDLDFGGPEGAVFSFEGEGRARWGGVGEGDGKEEGFFGFAEFELEGHDGGGIGSDA